MSGSTIEWSPPSTIGSSPVDHLADPAATVLRVSELTRQDVA